MKRLQESAAMDPSAPDGPGRMIIGRLVAIDEQKRPLVDYPGLGGSEPVPALCTNGLGRQHLGGDVVLMLEPGHGRPVVLGPVSDRIQEPPCPAAGNEEEVTVERDGQRLTLTAEQEIVLRCGKASITLTRAGKVVIRGAYVSSRSSGVNALKGGSVQIN